MLKCKGVGLSLCCSRGAHTLCDCSDCASLVSGNGALLGCPLRHCSSWLVSRSLSLPSFCTFTHRLLLLFSHIAHAGDLVSPTCKLSRKENKQRTAAAKNTKSSWCGLSRVARHASFGTRLTLLTSSEINAIQIR